MHLAKTAAIMLALTVLAGGGAADVIAPRPAKAATATDGRTRSIVAAADAFLASLSPAQRKEAMFAFNDAQQRARWSNFPNGIFQRAGLRYGELSASQRRLLMDLLGQVLSPYGVQMVRDQMGADDVLKANPALGGGPPGGPGGGPPPGGFGGPPP